MQRSKTSEGSPLLIYSILIIVACKLQLVVVGAGCRANKGNRFWHFVSGWCKLVHVRFLLNALRIGLVQTKKKNKQSKQPADEVKLIWTQDNVIWIVRIWRSSNSFKQRRVGLVAMCLLNEHEETYLAHYCWRHKLFSMLMSDLLCWSGAVWPQRQQFYMLSRGFSKQNEPEWREANQISFISEKAIACCPPTCKSGEPASCEIAAGLWSHDLPLWTYQLTWEPDNPVPHHWACFSQANSLFTHLTPFWPYHTTSHTSAPKKQR